jgi:K+-transporting ATPase A subunit
MSIGSKIAAHLDVGTIVTAIIGFLMVTIIQSGVGKLDKLTDQVSQLNERMVAIVTRTEYQKETDSAQNVMLNRIEDRIMALEKLNASREP